MVDANLLIAWLFFISVLFRRGNCNWRSYQEHARTKGNGKNIQEVLLGVDTNRFIVTVCQDKVLVNSGPHNEGVQVTNDGATILKSIGVDNPAAKVLVG